MQRLKQLSAIFAVDIAAYAVMENHYHAVVRLDPERAATWTDDEVLWRWTRLFAGPETVRRYRSALRKQMAPAERERVQHLAAVYRARLQDLSWFMRVLNESVARRANKEDECTGHFWEGRFRSQALLDEGSVLTAMAYVDLNPVRAGLSETPEDGDYTSIQERLGRAPPEHDRGPTDHEPTQARHSDTRVQRLAAANVFMAVARRTGKQQADLLPFDDSGKASRSVPCSAVEYVQLVDWMGRSIATGKRGYIPADVPPVLVRLGVDPTPLASMAASLLQEFASAVGAPAALARLCTRRRVRYLRGMRIARCIFKKVQEERLLCPGE